MRRSIRSLFATLAVAAIAAGCASTTGSNWTFAPTAPSAAAPVASSPAASEAVAQTPVGMVEIDAFDLGFTPNAIEVDAPGRYAITLRNTGTIPHDMTFPDGTTTGPWTAGRRPASRWMSRRAASRSSARSPATPRPGMKGDVTVKGATAAPQRDDHGGPTPSTDVAADPERSRPGHLRRRRRRPLLPGTVHDIDLVIDRDR